MMPALLTSTSIPCASVRERAHVVEPREVGDDGACGAGARSPAPRGAPRSRPCTTMSWPRSTSSAASARPRPSVDAGDQDRGHETSSMRVIAGHYGGRPPEGAARATPPGRPRTACARRCSPSWPRASHGARVLDLFAGSGALGLEALSRGADSVTFVDDAPAAIRAVKANLRGARRASARSGAPTPSASSARASGSGAPIRSCLPRPPVPAWRSASGAAVGGPPRRAGARGGGGGRERQTGAARRSACPSTTNAATATP